MAAKGPAITPSAFYEIDVAPGLEQVALHELHQQLGRLLQHVEPVDAQANSGTIRFTCRTLDGREVAPILQLGTIFNAYRVLTFPVSRPKALLAHENFTRLVTSVHQLRQQLPAGYFRTFALNAAGADSPVFQQLTAQLAAAWQLPIATTEVDLLLRIRPAHEAGQWEVLIRLSPRPLSVRAWRVADMKGALNAAVAHAMVHLTKPQAADNFLNLTCGSGTLLVERLLAAPARRLIGCDIDATALQYAQANLKAAQLQDRVELYDWDARSLNLPDRSVDAICADLPFGIAVGAHAQNVAHYPAILAEAARVAKPRGHFVLMTQEVTLLEALVQDNPTWKVLDQMMLTLRGLHPRIFVLQRTALPVR